MINRLTVSVTELSALVQAASSSDTLSRAVPLSNKTSNLFFSEVIALAFVTMLAELEFTETAREEEVVPFELMSVAFWVIAVLRFTPLLVIDGTSIGKIKSKIES